MKGIDISLCILVMLCGILEASMIVTSSPSFFGLFWGITIVVFLFGFWRFRYLDQDPKVLPRWRAGVSILLLVNILMLGFWLVIPPEDLILVLSAGSLIPWINFEEVGWFIALQLGLRPSPSNSNGIEKANP